jgi:hypothetical protein
VTRGSSAIYLGRARRDVEFLELGVLLRLSLVSEHAVCAVPAPELLHHRLRNRTRAAASTDAASVINNKPTDDDQISKDPATRVKRKGGSRAVRARGRVAEERMAEILRKGEACSVHLLLPSYLLPEL